MPDVLAPRRCTLRNLSARPVAAAGPEDAA